jgi:dTDP-4-amino-4,6-dideoxygalactose transaminase
MKDDLKTASTLALLSAFISPRLYWFPAGLPFLRLGETIFHEDYAVRRLSEFEALLLRDWRRTLDALNAVRREHGQFYVDHIAAARGYGASVAYLRFPLTLDGPETRSRLLIERNGKALGMSPMYPTSVARIPQLGGRLNPRDYPAAERLAASLITLPTHPLLSEKDRLTICMLLNESSSHLDGQTVRHRYREDHRHAVNARCS